MKRYEVYRNIRKKALIYGLPIAFFALMMLVIIGSLLVVIFSFSLGMIVSVVSLNLMVYFLLVRFAANPQLLNFRSVFPKMISNKKSTGLSYEN
ncbi:hypothetical protein V6B16_13565 [Salinimicrobium catena]|uniref:hypothetical protein n=1 Tax=Salinimicrobium catena TaxID=390640 RepID=UPI002FE4A8DB